MEYRIAIKERQVWNVAQIQDGTVEIPPPPQTPPPIGAVVRTGNQAHFHIGRPEPVISIGKVDLTRTQLLEILAKMSELERIDWQNRNP
jgi:hypothetical protein